MWFVLCCSLLGVIQGVHHRLNKRELHTVFGVDSPENVPEYSLARIEKVLDGEHLDVRLHAFNDTFVVRLKRNIGLIHPEVRTIIRDGDQVQQQAGTGTWQTDCHWHGQLLSHGKGKVALSDCRSMLGTLTMADHFLVLHPLPRRVHHFQEEQHIVYKRDAGLLGELERGLEEELVKLNDISGTEFCDSSQSLDSPLTADLFSLNYSVPQIGSLESAFIFPQMDPITLEIGLFLDSKLFEHFQREYSRDAEQHLMDFSLALINNVHVLYQQPTLSPNLDIVIVRFEMWKTQPEGLETSVHRNGQAQSLLDAFCRHQSRINPGTDLTDNGHWDHGVLLTGYDIYHTTASVAGVAPVARMCDPLFACSLVEGLHLGRSFVLAHEMGHNMGMVHDGVQNQCSRSCCLMSAVNGAGKTTWSECSVREFNAFLLQLDESGRGNCLRDASPGLITHSHTKDGRLPGQRFTADQQCSYFWGRDYVVEIPNGRSIEDICRILWCGNGGSTISTAHPALEGSWCGGEKWCQEGQCSNWRASGSRPVPVDGNWSPWAGEHQCPVRQCHVTNSIHIKPQHRECVDPAPNNGGKSCPGSPIRGILCGESHSSCSGLNRQEYGDRVCGSLQNDPARPDKQLTGKSFNHGTQPCRVWCHLVDSELIRNKGQFPDGSPCGHNAYCVGGYCLRLSCAEQALVAHSGDCPNGAQPEPWGEWSPWSECSTSCGEGRQVRKRECPNEQCEGKKRERRSCEPVNPPCEDVGEWSDWGECTAECGTGVRTRTRTCKSTVCNSPLLEQKRCHKGACWSPWQDWTACSVTCGGGKRIRRRECPEGDCPGPSQQTEECNESSCPITEVWGDWLPCSVSCGIGFQLRERLCNGILCGTNNRQARTCNEETCPLSDRPATWDSWSEWSTCSASCGEGYRQRTRKCTKASCPAWEASSERRRCVLGPCPEWSEWGAWTECPDCSAISTRSRVRVCSALFPLFNSPSVVCEGPAAEVESCLDSCSHSQQKRLTTKSINDSAPHEWGEWTAWSDCSATCGDARRTRKRDCKSGTCPPDGASQAEICTLPICATAISGWHEWSEWSGCKAGVCGEETRRRVCAFPFACPTVDSVETRQCKCDRSKMLVPEWSEWSEWADCSCFSLTTTRRRFCRVRDPSLQGFCAGTLVEQKVCAPESCGATNGDWSQWSEWSECSRDCKGTGHQIRNRMCASPIPANRGSFCTGLSFDQRACESSLPCGAKVDGGWGEWSDWSKCSDNCGGHSSRTRFCSNPRPGNGGSPCFGADFELHPCSDLSQCKHSTDGEWGSWSPWTKCPDDCNFSLQSRERRCDSPAPTRGGAPCDGLAQMTSVCTPASTNCTQWKESEWHEWSEWSSCLSNCGTGKRYRSRECSSKTTPCFGRSAMAARCTDDLSLCLGFLNSSALVESQLHL